MDKKELLELLDLKETRAGPIEESALQVSDQRVERHREASATALVVDTWGYRRGEELHQSCERLQSLQLEVSAVVDCQVAAFDPEPQLTTGCSDPLRREFFAALLETPEYRALHESTKLDTNASEIAAIHFAEQLNSFLRDASPVTTDPHREIAALKAVSRAVTEASAEVDEFRDAVAAFGLGPGCPGGNDPKAIAELFRRIRNDAALRSISSLAGRYRRLAQSRQRRKTRHGLDDVAGVEMSGDLGRVLPHELLKLTVAPWDLESLRRFTERQLMSREHRASEPVGRGPILVVVDESGSMVGEPVHAAKAIALALAWIARQQRRWCALVAYSGDSGERLLPLPPGRWNEEGLADWLTQFLGRGSTLDVPLRELPEIYDALRAPKGDTDVIAVTDCVCRVPESVAKSFLAWKESVQARLITLVIGDDAGDLNQVSDEVHLVRSLAVGEEAVGRVLSI